jgi:hypothetical protein
VLSGSEGDVRKSTSTASVAFFEGDVPLPGDDVGG